ncbi:hypothetical protein COLO4_15879 [Corchorus olitorius]|uniref:Uncharacterized protein n=1 Tax=Corchorus olitorius TaxID=93759 RepID=A0A1R3JKV0_9ROSI|nr:hypothetical protein COLO4_15879 [Corchorus olitorius]
MVFNCFLKLVISMLGGEHFLELFFRKNFCFNFKNF